MVAPALWGCTYIVFRELLPHGHPLGVAAIRALAGALLLALWSRRGRPRLPRATHVWVLGALNIAVFSGLLMFAATRLSGGHVATLASTQPLWAALWAWPLLGRRPARAVLLASVAASVGVWLLIAAHDARVDLGGVIAAIAAALSMAAGTVLLERWADRATPSETATDQLFIGGLLLLPVALVLEGPMPAPDPSALLGWLLLVPLGTSLAFALWVRGAQRLGPSAAFLGLASPVVAVAIDVVWMGTWTSTSQWAGSALVLGSTAVGIGRPLPRTNRP
jgi:probable blue pigment (indigoidine) exporter